MRSYCFWLTRSHIGTGTLIKKVFIYVLIAVTYAMLINFQTIAFHSIGFVRPLDASTECIIDLCSLTLTNANIPSGASKNKVRVVNRH